MLKLISVFMIVIALSSILTYSARAQETYNYIYTTQWGSYGSGNGQFYNPSGIIVDSAGNVYVADTNNNRIQKFSSNGTYLLQWGSRGSGPGQFLNPTSMALDSAGNIYVVDSGNNRIEVFTNQGTYVTTFGEAGAAVAIDRTGNVYLTVNSSIQKFTSGGIYLSQYGGGQGTGNDQFMDPTGIAIDNLGNVFVVDYVNNCVEKFDNNGTYLTQWGGSVGSDSRGNGQLFLPTGIAVDNSGNVFVADTDNQRIQMFSNEGTYITQFGDDGGTAQLYAPRDVAIDNQGNAYVADSGNNRIVEFSL
jgi:tripartite motif-containing protein 71